MSLKDFLFEKNKKEQTLLKEKSELEEKLNSDFLSLIPDSLLKKHSLTVRCKVSLDLFEIFISSSSNSSLLSNYKSMVFYWDDDFSSKLFFPKFPTTMEDRKKTANDMEIFSEFTSFCLKDEKMSSFIYKELPYRMKSINTLRTEIAVNKNSSDSELRKTIVNEFANTFSKVGAKIPELLIPIGMNKSLVTNVEVIGNGEDILTISYIFNNKIKKQEFRTISFRMVLIEFAKADTLKAEETISLFLKKKNIQEKIKNL